ncbi:hypothetical protein BKA59DRAFT_187539 [Fusarium tricinctum]|uniref:Uncharacterized protein n=1 Tax=Fusarium tricinctum TaxID=61284 RepID=A0A8K0RY12_9HYPO|nr:hypothetical protein BKA59DRAFT_187539 [Fusarium tricinctum]
MALRRYSDSVAFILSLSRSGRLGEVSYSYCGGKVWGWPRACTTLSLSKRNETGLSVELAKNLTYHSRPLFIRFRSHNIPLRRNLNFRRRHVFLETLEAGTTWRLQCSATAFSTVRLLCVCAFFSCFFFRIALSLCFDAAGPGPGLTWSVASCLVLLTRRSDISHSTCVPRILVVSFEPGSLPEQLRLAQICMMSHGACQGLLCHACLYCRFCCNEQG